MCQMNPLADKVRLERVRRGWSVRKCASLGEISNTWWAKFEEGKQPLSEAITLAVAKAFDWEMDWATQPGAVDVDVLAAVAQQVRTSAAEVGSLRGAVRSLEGELRRLQTELAELRNEVRRSDPPGQPRR